MLRVTKVDRIREGHIIYAFGKQYVIKHSLDRGMYDLLGVCEDDGQRIMLDKVYKTKFGDDAGGFYYRVICTDNNVAILQDSQLNVVQK